MSKSELKTTLYKMGFKSTLSSSSYKLYFFDELITLEVKMRNIQNADSAEKKDIYISFLRRNVLLINYPIWIQNN